MSTVQANVGAISGLITPNRSYAQSEPARRILELQEQLREHLLNSFVVRDARERLLNELDNLALEASAPNWDGYGANPVTFGSYNFARAFIKALPTTAHLPEVTIETDGEVALDWHFGKRRALSVSIGAMGRCSYAWILGNRTGRGTDWIEDEIPAQIVSALRQLDPA